MTDEYGLSRTPLQDADFEYFISQSIQKAPGDFPMQRAHQVAAAVLFWHLGEKWVSKYVLVFGNEWKSGFLFNEVTDHPRATHFHRVVTLGELLFNLRVVPGVEAVIERLRSGDIESAYAELEVGKYLAMARTFFRFVIPKGKRGDNYDVELRMPWGQWVCADTKCKIETGTFRRNTIINTLRDNRDQVPRDKPGMFFIKIPQQWLPSGADYFVDGVDPEVPEITRELASCAEEFLRGTGRIVNVIFFTGVFRFIADNVLKTMGGIELVNPNHRFDHGRDWRLLSGRADSYDPRLPPGWRELVRFFYQEIP